MNWLVHIQFYVMQTIKFYYAQNEKKSAFNGSFYDGIVWSVIW